MSNKYMNAISEACGEALEKAAFDKDTYRAVRIAQQERANDLREQDSIRKSVDNRISRLGSDDLRELKAKLSAMRGYSTAYDSAYEVAPYSTLNRSLAGAGIGAIGAGAVGAMIAILRKNPKIAESVASAMILGGIGGAGVGAANSVVNKSKFADKNSASGEHYAKGVATRDYNLSNLTKSDIERHLHDMGRYYSNPAYSIEEEWDELDGSARPFYKKASEMTNKYLEKIAENLSKQDKEDLDKGRTGALNYVGRAARGWMLGGIGTAAAAAAIPKWRRAILDRDLKTHIAVGVAGRVSGGALAAHDVYRGFAKNRRLDDLEKDTDKDEAVKAYLKKRM